MTEAQVAALEQWAKQERDYATEMGCGTDYTSVNKLRDVLALCASWREGQEDNLTLQLIIDGDPDLLCTTALTTKDYEPHEKLLEIVRCTMSRPSVLAITITSPTTPGTQLGLEDAHGPQQG